jgi:hypothetical protein
VRCARGKCAGLRRAIEFWRRVTELSKNAEGDLSAWAHCAVRFGDADSASKALDAMLVPGKETADYHALRADVALIRHDLVGYEKASKLEPRTRRIASAREVYEQEPKNPDYAATYAFSLISKAT